MSTFIVIPTAEAWIATLDEKIKAFGTSAYRLPRGEWLIKFDGTSKQLSDQLGISVDVSPRPPGSPMGVVLLFNSYWGHGPKDVWEWIDLNQK